MNASNVSLPAVFRRKLGNLRIDAASLGGDRVGFVVEGPADAVTVLAVALRNAQFMVETYPEDATTIYAESGTRPEDFEEDTDVTRRYPVGFTSAMVAAGSL